MVDEAEANPFIDPRQPPARELTRLSPLVRRLIAPNASPFTFNGTCTYIVGQGAVAVVDPGPGHESHLAAILEAVEGERIETILVTHTHRDHSVLANALREVDRRAHRRRSAVLAQGRRERRPRIPRTTAPTRLTKFSPTARISRGGDLPSKPSQRLAIAPITCASRFWKSARSFPAIT